MISGCIYSYIFCQITIASIFYKAFCSSAEGTMLEEISLRLGIALELCDSSAWKSQGCANFQCTGMHIKWSTLTGAAVCSLENTM